MQGRKFCIGGFDLGTIYRRCLGPFDDFAFDALTMEMTTQTIGSASVMACSNVGVGVSSSMSAGRHAIKCVRTITDRVVVQC